uniref:Uncharacterized protein n=1 Tax=uncultured Nitrospirae bacterium MY2-3C TaxID=798577 RepID=D9MNY9_9BACT|nr:hypothetical protein LW2_0030 [uncultured Nitrospirae bacterium MY2-3C]
MPNQPDLVFLLNIIKRQFIQKDDKIIAIGSCRIILCQMSGELVCLLYPPKDYVTATGSLLFIEQHPYVYVY